MKNLLLTVILLCFCLPFVKAADQKMILISTNETDLIPGSYTHLHEVVSDFLMMGRYFARFDESPTKKMKIGNNFVKEYWGEGSNRAKNWQRYDMGGNESLKFEEGVDSYVPYAGKLKDNLNVTLGKMIATMCSCCLLYTSEILKHKL